MCDFILDDCASARGFCFIVIVAVTATKQLTDINLLGIIGFYVAIHLGRYAHKGIPAVVNIVLAFPCAYFRQFCWKIL